MREFSSLYIADLPMRVGWTLDTHTHEHGHELVLVAAGAIETRIASQTIITRAGSAKFHPRRVGHAERALGATPARLLLVCWAWRDDDGTADWPLMAADRRGRLRMLLDWLLALGPGAANAELRQRLIGALFAEYAGGGAEEDELVAGVRAHIAERLSEPIYLGDLARAVGMSRFHFARRFRRLTGQSPMGYVRAMRVDAVRSLLLSSGLPLRAIAPRVGFADEFQLSRVFRQVTGQSPRQARRLAAGPSVKG